jgi:hypothetical protein
MSQDQLKLETIRRWWSTAEPGEALIKGEIDDVRWLLAELTKEREANAELLKEVNGWRARARTTFLKQYKYKCSSCGSFARYYTNSCRSCGAEGGYSGSFKQEDLEKWYDAKSATLEGNEPNEQV